MAQRYALPPGLYYIQANIADGKYIKNPDTDGAALSLVDTQANASKWMIFGDGTIRAMGTKNRFAWANLDNGIVPQALTRSATAVKWIINTLAVAGDPGYYPGRICSNVEAQHCAEADSRNNTVVLHLRQNTEEDWRFYPTT